MKKILVSFFLGIILFLQNLVAQNDTLTNNARKVTLCKKAIIPTALIGIGLLVQKENGFYSRYDARRDIQNQFPDFHTSIDDYMPFAPLAAVYMLDFSGIKGEKPLLEFSKIMIVSQALNMGIVYAIKETSNVERPDASANNSMPSGHTAFAFASATLFYEQYKEKGWLYQVTPFVVAGTTGIFRMMNNRHWLSDVLVGAGLGILTTEFVWHYYPRIFPAKKKTKSDFVLFPTIQNKKLTASLLICF